MKYYSHKKQYGGQIGATAGSAVGSAAVAAIPGVGPFLSPLGGTLGGIAGKAIGSSFDKKPKRQLEVIEGSDFAKGGALPIGKGARKYVGPRHSKGGIPVDENGTPTKRKSAVAEVEGGETVQQGYVFSDRLIVPGTEMTFAQVHEQLVKKGDQKSIEQLAQMQEQMNGQESAQMYNGGNLKKLEDGGKTEETIGERIKRLSSKGVTLRDFPDLFRRIQDLNQRTEEATKRRIEAERQRDLNFKIYGQPIPEPLVKANDFVQRSTAGTTFSPDVTNSTANPQEVVEKPATSSQGQEAVATETTQLPVESFPNRPSTGWGSLRMGLPKYTNEDRRRRTTMVEVPDDTVGGGATKLVPHYSTELSGINRSRPIAPGSNLRLEEEKPDSSNYFETVDTTVNISKAPKKPMDVSNLIASTLPSAMRIGAAIGAPRPTGYGRVSYRPLSTTSPTFANEQRRMDAGFRAASGVNPQAAYASYLDASSNLAAREAEFRAAREEANEQRRAQVEAANLDLRAREKQEREADMGQRISLALEGVSMPFQQRMMDRAAKRNAIAQASIAAAAMPSEREASKLIQTVADLYSDETKAYGGKIKSKTSRKYVGTKPPKTP